MSDDSALILDGPAAATDTVVLAHGAGAPMDTPFMQRMAEGLAGRGIRVVRFEFPYMQVRRATGRRKPPDRLPALRERWLRVLEELGGAEGLIIGGKSMGGRIASMLADEVRPRGLICLGYPFHPPGKPDRLRVEHLRELGTPALIVQGTRDALGSQEEVGGYELSPTIDVVFLEDGDHSFKPRVRSGCTEAQNLEQALEAMAGFVASLPAR